MPKLSKETTAYKNKLSYIDGYRKKNNKAYYFEINKNTEADLYDFFNGIKGKATLIKRLLREEMNRAKSE